MKTTFNATRNGTNATATEFHDFTSAIRFMQEKKRQGYTTTFPSLHNRIYVVYTWRREK